MLDRDHLTAQMALLDACQPSEEDSPELVAYKDVFATNAQKVLDRGQSTEWHQHYLRCMVWDIQKLSGVDVDKPGADKARDVLFSPAIEFIYGFIGDEEALLDETAQAGMASLLHMPKVVEQLSGAFIAKTHLVRASDDARANNKRGVALNNWLASHADKPDQVQIVRATLASNRDEMLGTPVVGIYDSWLQRLGGPRA
jgi:hypothetical protein